MIKRFIIITLIISVILGIPAYMWGYSVGYRWGKELNKVSYEERLVIKNGRYAN